MKENKENVKIYKFDVIDSTNDYLRRDHNNHEEFDVISAEIQTHSKARRNNDWVSLEGMATFSFFLNEKKEIKMEDYLKLPLLAGLAVINGLKKVENLDYKFKWTNDVYLENKKLCGILMEKADDIYIVGIGLNVNNILPKFLENKAISLTQIKNKEYEIDEIITNIVYEFKLLFKNLENGFWKEILSQINEINYLKNKNIELKFGNEIISGIAQDINKDGEIEISIHQDEKQKSVIKSFSVGEVFEKIKIF